MVEALSGPRLEAFKALKLDDDFFQKCLQRVDTEAEGPDSDLYLMEKSVMPLLMQGLEALSRHVDKMTTSGAAKSKVPFNPLTWLAQYMLRNHPNIVKDHRTPMYHKFSELALAERGRRELLRRRAQMEEMWRGMEKEFKASRGKENKHMTASDVPDYIKNLDERWGLEGMFKKKMPVLELDYASLLEEGRGYLLFDEFWKWFEAYITEHDVVRASLFEEAERKRREAEERARRLQEERERRERNIQEVHEMRQALEEQFDNLSADVYINDGLGEILNKGVCMELPEPGEVLRKDALPIVGEHISLLLNLLWLWGCTMPDSAPQDQWSDAAVEAWLTWQEKNAPDDLEKSRKLGAEGLRAMLNRDAYLNYLLSSNQINLDEEMHNIVNHLVEIRCIMGETEDTLDFLVEALDEETGEILHLSLPEACVEEVRQRLDKAGGEALLARVDLVSARVKELVAPEDGDAF